VRRAALHLALLKGDALGVARAWDRLRVSGASLRPEEAEAARDARAAVGHALRDARWRRSHDDDRFGFPVGPERPDAGRPSLRRGPARALVLATAAVLFAVLVLIYQTLAPGGTRLAAPEQPSAAPSALAGAGRGRTSATLAPLVVTTATPAVPSPAPAAQPSPSGGPGSGTGLGVGALPPKPDSDDRFIFVVLDSQTTRPLSGVCVAYGGGCDRRRTDAQGYWWIDFPRGGALADKWRFDFVLEGYQFESREVHYVPGEINVPVAVMLRRASS
jgi:hypothetical protein